MRKITKNTIDALKTGKRLSTGNMLVKDGNVYLHGNLIASLENLVLTVTDAGWQTNTTKERLNGILDGFGLQGIYQKKHVWYFQDGTRWTGSTTFYLDKEPKVLEILRSVIK